MFPVDHKDFGEIPGNQDAILVGCGAGYGFRNRFFFCVCGLRTVAVAKFCLQLCGEPQCHALQQSGGFPLNQGTDIDGAYICLF
mgnify:CR=1 FL=1